MSDARAPLRGTATGLLTAALAVAAHGVAGGGAPSGASVVQLLVIAATVGALASVLTGGLGVLLGLLGAGQLISHVSLGAVGHAHAPAGAAMLAAHVFAVALGALLICAGDRLCGAVSRVLTATAAAVTVPVCAPRPVLTTADQPLHWMLLLTASMSHRGPPGCPAR
ncbi:hypothetical protein [Mycolicibacterium sp.]|uniref:hypothetical protein n=1 Tax=Mycolicibacterium sp. TaxID=2320850 RepID=UPI003D11B7D7